MEEIWQLSLWLLEKLVVEFFPFIVCSVCLLRRVQALNICIVLSFRVFSCKMISMRSEKPICAPPRLTEVSHNVLLMIKKPWRRRSLRIPHQQQSLETVSYTHLRAHETQSNLVCRLLLEKIFLMIRRPPRSTLFRSSAASDVYKRQTSCWW